jgi:hypothetical protein
MVLTACVSVSGDARLRMVGVAASVEGASVEAVRLKIPQVGCDGRMRW